MKRYSIIPFLLAFTLVFSFPCLADQTDEPTIVTEYFSDEMFENFETLPAVPTAATAAELTLSCTSAVLMEKSSGKVLYELNANEQRAPASITKIMTLLLIMESIEEGKIALNHKVTGSAHARSMGGSQIWLEDGETMTVDDLLKAVCVASANDGAVALAEHHSGSEEAFVAAMNRRAKELGMKNTNFVNCCGLDAENHYTTARDIAIMSKELLNHPLITQYSTLWMDSLRGGETQLVNTNKLVRFYEGATGLKTGTTDEAGYCVSATAQKNGMELIAVVLNGATSDKRFSDAKAMLNYGFANYALSQVNPAETLLSPLPVSHGTQPTVELTPLPAGPFLVEKGGENHLTASVSLPQRLEAPVAQGQVVGKITYSLENQTVGETNIVASTSVSPMTFLAAFRQIWLECIKM